MSDSDVNTGIQDTLSSVKRLVHEDAHEESGFIFIPTAPVPKPGRLLLTDDLRVSDEPLIPEKPGPLKLMPWQAMREGGPAGAANAPKSPAAEPMRLLPGDVVRAGGADARAAASEDASQRDPAGSLSARIEALEAAIVRTEDQWDPDGESDDAYPGTRTKAVEWPVGNGVARTWTEETKSRSEPAVTFIRDPGVIRGQAGEPATLNLGEEALRDLVARIVREELKGALGERITRNLRKMIRREIARAVTARGAE